MKNQMEKYNVLILGDECVGKSNILTRFLYQKFFSDYLPTIALDSFGKTINLEDKKIRLLLWDSGGQERFRSLIPRYIKDSAVVVVVYDVTNRQSFSNVDKFIQLVRNERGTDVILVLFGNKCDLVEKRQVSIEEGNAKATTIGATFAEASAKDGSGIKPIFEKIAAKLLEINTHSSTKEEDKGDVNLDSSSKTSESNQGTNVETPKNSMKLDHEAKDEVETIESLKKKLEQERSARIMAEQLLEQVRDEQRKLYATLRAIVNEKNI